jgi:hypothetical protein
LKSGCRLCALITAAVLVALASPRPALAQIASALRVEATPVLGADSALTSGWLSIVVRLDNASMSPIEGTLEVAARPPWGDGARFVTTAPFAVGGRSRVTLRVPTHGIGSMRATFQVRVLDAEGRLLVGTQLPEARTGGFVLFDFSTPSRLAAALQGLSVAASSSPYGSTPVATPVSVTGPAPNSTTGEPVLPDRGIGYSAAMLIVAPSADLARMPEDEGLALTDWVLGGGALAIVVTRPEDLSVPLVKAFVGGVATTKAPPRELEQPAGFLVPDTTSAAAPRAVRRMGRPSPATVATLIGYGGANLYDTRWGAAASYGLGEVHLLAFDPLRSAPVREDEWTRLSLLELMRHAVGRRDAVAFQSGVRPLDDARIDELRRLLDPNEGSRWTVVAAALLLLAYAVVAGPWSFARAQRRGKPERALLYLPMWSAGTLSAIVVLGVLGKGVEGRARRIGLIEAGAGMPSASVTRFRGLYSARSERLTVWSSEPDAVLDVTGGDTDIDRRMVVDREGLRLEGLMAKPWETVVVREDAFVSIGGGVSIAQKADGAWMIANRCARDLIGVIVRATGDELHYFPRIADGASVALTSGKKLTLGAVTYAGRRALDVGSFSGALDADVQGASAAWRALETLAEGTDWWPLNTPVLIAQLDGGEGTLADAGLRIESDRTLVRVVGRGGVP